MHTVTWGRTRANLRALKQKMGSPLGGAIFDGNHQYWYQINQWIILHALVGVAKQYRKYFRFRAKNHFSIFHPYLKSHLRSKIVRISWKFGQLCKMSQIIIIYEKKISENIPLTRTLTNQPEFSEKSNHKLALKAKKPFCVGGKFLKIFFL